MQKRTVAIIGVVVLLIGAAIVWKLTSGGSHDKADAPDQEDRASAFRSDSPKRVGGDDDATGQQMPPRVLMDDDPEGPLLLEGQVLDSNDKGIGGAVVTLSSNPPRTTTTEADGSFSFDKLVGRMYSVTARAGELVGGPVVHKLTADSGPVAIRMKVGASVIVTVVDRKTDEPISGATVSLRSDGERSESTDGDGNATFTGVAGGWFVVAADAQGYAPLLQAVQVADSPGVEATTKLSLRRGAKVTGKVVDTDGKPIAGARIVAKDASAVFSLVDPRRDSMVSDAEGSFTMPAVAIGTYRFEATHDSYAPSSSELVSVDGNRPVDGVVIEMARGASLAGKVVDANGAPVPWASVRVGSGRQGFDEIESQRVRQTTADENGEFSLQALRPVKLVAMAISEQASSALVPVDLGADHDVDDLVLTLDITGVIAGRVVDSDGEPIPEAQVTAFPDFFGGGPSDDFSLRGITAETTDGGGAFTFRGLPEGTYRLRASRSSVSTSDFWQRGTQAATGDENVELVVQANGALTGKVEFTDGGSPEVFSVAIGYPPGVPVSNSSGAFDVPDVPPGKYDVTFRGQDFADVTVRDIEVEAGEAADMGTVKVKRGRTIAGRVVDKSGSPVGGATVIAAKRLFGDGSTVQANFGAGSDEAQGVRKITTEDDGRFELSGISNGEMMVVGNHEEIGRSSPAIIPPGRSSPEFELVLRPFGRVVGTVRVGEAPAKKTTVTATPLEGSTNQTVIVNTGDDGAFVIEKLPEGRHRLAAIIQSGFTGANSAGTDVTVVGGKEVRADITIEVGDITLVVKIIPRDGATIDFAQAFLFQGQASPANGQEVQDQFLARSDSGGATMALSLTGDSVTFPKIKPGDYTVCVIPITGDMSDPLFQQRLQERAFELQVYCEPRTVDASPAEQSHEAVVPAMEPFADTPTP